MLCWVEGGGGGGGADGTIALLGHFGVYGFDVGFWIEWSRVLECCVLWCGCVMIVACSVLADENGELPERWRGWAVIYS